MGSILYVGLGGAIGAMLRFWMSQAITKQLGHGFPYGTLAVNILGCLAMGLLAGGLVKTMPVHAPEIRAFVGVGILGGFTTFSAFSLETVMLMERGDMAQAGIYVAASVIACIFAVWLGMVLLRGQVI